MRIRPKMIKIIVSFLAIVFFVGLHSTPVNAAWCVDDTYRTIVGIKMWGHRKEFKLKIDTNLSMHFHEANPNLTKDEMTRIYSLAMAAFLSGVSVRGYDHQNTASACSNVDHLMTEGAQE